MCAPYPAHRNDQQQELSPFASSPPSGCQAPPAVAAFAVPSPSANTSIFLSCGPAVAGPVCFLPQAHFLKPSRPCTCPFQAHPSPQPHFSPPPPISPRRHHLPPLFPFDFPVFPCPPPPVSPPFAPVSPPVFLALATTCRLVLANMEAWTYTRARTHAHTHVPLHVCLPGHARSSARAHSELETVSVDPCNCAPLPMFEADSQNFCFGAKRV